MAHFAQLNEDNYVIQVIVVGNSDIRDEHGNESEEKGIAFCKGLLGGETRWKQTSYNSNIRKNYAGIGYLYDSVRDAFIPPKPYNSWVLNEETCQWKPPIDLPADGVAIQGVNESPKQYYWNEEIVNWSEMTPSA